MHWTHLASDPTRRWTSARGKTARRINQPQQPSDVLRRLLSLRWACVDNWRPQWAQAMKLRELRKPVVFLAPFNWLLRKLTYSTYCFILLLVMCCVAGLWHSFTVYSSPSFTIFCCPFHFRVLCWWRMITQHNIIQFFSSAVRFSLHSSFSNFFL